MIRILLLGMMVNIKIRFKNFKIKCASVLLVGVIFMDCLKLN
jgi:hypothetical protein